MKIKKMVMLALIVLILIVIISGIYYFYTPVKYSNVYEELFSVSKDDVEAIDKKFQNNVGYFNSAKEWNNFASSHLENGNIPLVENKNGSFVVIITDMYKDKESSLTEIDSLKRSFLSYKITLRERAKITIVSGFRDDEIVKNILVYQINSHLLGSDFIEDINIVYN